MTTGRLDKFSLRDQLMRELARGTSDLPALPRAVSDAMRLARKPDLDFRAVSELAEKDPPLAARLLAIANSALYARGEPVLSVMRAVVRLGTQATRDVLYQAAYASILVDVPKYHSVVEANFQHSVLVARIARDLAGEKKTDEDGAFLSGLLHDVGHARLWRLIAKLTTRANEVAEAEAIVEELHARAGADLATVWRLPKEVIEVCLWHHMPHGRPGVVLIAAANVLAHAAESKATADQVKAMLTAAEIDSSDIEQRVARATELRKLTLASIQLR